MRSSSLVAPILTTLALLSSIARAAGADEARASHAAGGDGLSAGGGCGCQ